ncbi:2Fe-2S iron-sulfur cluster binding domain-containing protein [candidate division KSB1 bacterium]|nr:2Fe-2S iron-sulfur cluster binding domain-containing protein [candidate division KSB1 bacterium]
MITKILIATLSMAGISGLLAIILVIAERYLANYGECKITINNQKDLIVKGGSTLLSTLNSQKIFLPSACGGRGTCAYCKCKVIDGVGPLLPTEEPLLNKQEIENQIRLACQVKVKQDMLIEIPEELFNIKEFETRVTLIQDLTHDIKLVRLQLIEPYEIFFKAGQYVQLITAPYAGVKESVSRAYSVASASHEHDHVDLMIRLVPEGICTTWVHNYLNENERVKIIGPMGDFYLRDGEGEIIMVAGGSGMAPIVSLLEKISKEDIERKVTYFFGAVRKKDLFYIDEMRNLENEIGNFTFIPALSAPEPEDNWDGETGLITEPLDRYLSRSDNATSQAYLCGSPGMINACINVFVKHGITRDRIFNDPFA